MLNDFLLRGKSLEEPSEKSGLTTIEKMQEKIGEVIRNLKHLSLEFATKVKIIAGLAEDEKKLLKRSI